MDEIQEIEVPKVGDRLDQLSLRAFQGLPSGTVATYKSGIYIGEFTLHGKNWTLANWQSGVIAYSEFWMARISTLPVVS